MIKFKVKNQKDSRLQIRWEEEAGYWWRMRLPPGVYLKVRFSGEDFLRLLEVLEMGSIKELPPGNIEAVFEALGIKKTKYLILKSFIQVLPYAENIHFAHDESKTLNVTPGWIEKGENFPENYMYSPVGAVGTIIYRSGTGNSVFLFRFSEHIFEGHISLRMYDLLREKVVKSFELPGYTL